jgi:hypothetical protein
MTTPPYWAERSRLSERKCALAHFCSKALSSSIFSVQSLSLMCVFDSLTRGKNAWKRESKTLQFLGKLLNLIVSNFTILRALELALICLWTPQLVWIF